MTQQQHNNNKLRLRPTSSWLSLKIRVKSGLRTMRVQWSSHCMPEIDANSLWPQPHLPAPPRPASGHKGLTHMVRFLSCVDSQVALQSLKVPESGATDFTGIGLLASVDEHMGTEVGHLHGRAKSKQTKRLGRGGLRPPGASYQHTGWGSVAHAPCSPGQIWLRTFRICRASLQSEFGCGFSGWPVG